MPWSEVLDQLQRLPLQEGASLRELANVRDQSLTWANRWLKRWQAGDRKLARIAVVAGTGCPGAATPSVEGAGGPRQASSIGTRKAAPASGSNVWRMYWARTAQCLDRVRLTEPSSMRVPICPPGMARRADLLSENPESNTSLVSRMGNPKGSSRGPVQKTMLA